MNNKGFSLVELLAIITILGLIMGTAIPAYQQYVTKTRKEAYDTLITTVRTAAQNKYINDGMPTGCQAYGIEDLYTMGYMDKPSDPASTSDNCQGTAVIFEDTGDDQLIENYNITVVLNCSTYKTKECLDSSGKPCGFLLEDCNIPK